LKGKDMAKGLTYILDENDKRYSSGWFSPTRNLTITYGMCANSPYMENNLWFVTIPAGWRDEEINEHTPKEANFPRRETTFLVTEQFAREIILKDFGRDVDKWHQVAHKVIVGDWCEKYECLWTELPIYLHKLENGKVIKYGYCLSPKKYPERELWFVAYQKDTLGTQNGVIILMVDKRATKSEMLDYLGTNTKQWLKISWVGINDLHQWDDYKTGINLKWVQDYDGNFEFPRSDNALNTDKQLQLYEEEIVRLPKSPTSNRAY
jgi:hypothetical protein